MAQTFKDTKPFMVDPRLREISGFCRAEPMTGAEISLDGLEVILVGKRSIFRFKRNSGESVPDAMKRDPTILGPSVKGQCESVTFDDKSGFYSISQKGKPMHYFERE